MQVITEAYLEIAERINEKIPEIRWIDLWHNQIGFLKDEHPFPSPAVFLAFRKGNSNDLGLKVQDANVQIDMYLFFETFADTFKGSYNQESALDFLRLLDDLQKHFHGYSGESFSEMSGGPFRPVDTGGAGNLYVRTFSCMQRDYEAMPESTPIEEPEEEQPLFTV